MSKKDEKKEEKTYPLVSPEKVEKYYNVSVEATKEFAVAMDKNDPLGRFRQEFEMPQGHSSQSNATIIYLCGNSLGPLSKRARAYINEEVNKWSTMAVEGHFNGARPWIRIDEKSQRLLVGIVGARNESEIAVMNGLTVNCHLMFMSFYQPTTNRHKVIIEGQAFCSDHHLVRSQIEYHNFNVKDSLIELNPREKEGIIRTEDIFKVIEEHKDSVALIWLGALQFYTGQLFEMEKITKKAHEYNIIVGFDCAHAVGNVPLKLHEWGVDFATWCGYKYLNGGPGGMAGVFVHERFNDEPLKKLKGWWGQKESDKINMHSNKHVAIMGAQSWRLSNPPVLPVVSLEASLEIFRDAGIQNLRYKSVCLTRYLEMLLEKYLSKFVVIITPKDPEQRGCQLSLVFTCGVEKAHEIITEQGIICDIRRPDVIRIAPNPLYNTFEEVWNFVSLLKDALDVQLKQANKTE